jgi:hypothetical protein
MKAAIPTGAEVTREVIIVLAGAIIAAAVIGQLPALRSWIKEQWQDAPRL